VVINEGRVSAEAVRACVREPLSSVFPAASKAENDSLSTVASMKGDSA
jgi:hypothetical protein